MKRIPVLIPSISSVSLTGILSMLVAGMTSLVSSAEAAEIGLCAAGASIPEAIYQREIYLEQGEKVRLAISQGSLGATQCRRADVDLGGARVLWSAPLPIPLQAQPGRRAVILQGEFPPESLAAVSEVIPVPQVVSRAAPVSRIRFGQNLVAILDRQVWGIEERASWQGSGRLLCRGGTRPAGLLLRSPLDWPAGAPAHLDLRVNGEGRFRLGVADAHRLREEETVSVGEIQLAGTETQTYRFVLPESDSPWRALSLSCPEQGGTVTLEAITLLPGAPVADDTSSSSQSAWIWSPRRWQEDPDFFWELAAQETLDTFYITVPVSEGGVADSASLADFVSAASARDIRIWPVIGDYRDVLADSMPAMRNRLSAYADYNRTAAPAARLAGVQLDVEPYLLPGFGIDPGYWRDRYLAMLREVRASTGEELEIDLVLPVWWGSHPDWGDDFLNDLAPFNVSVTVMNYRTEIERLQMEAMPFLDWGSRHQRPVRIALETGSLNDEMRRSYERSAGAGELWQVQLGGQAVLILLDRSMSGLSGQSFVQVDETVFSASNLTFGGASEQLHSVVEHLQQYFARWDDFAGIALHGLEEMHGTELP